MTEFVAERPARAGHAEHAEAGMGWIGSGIEAGAESLVRELTGRERDLPCFVRHEDAGGKCDRNAVVQVYGLKFCELHGTEARTGALKELYEDAREFMQRLDNPHVEPPNAAVLAIVRDTASMLLDAQKKDEDAIRRAYPVIPERVEEDTQDFDYEDPNPRSGPVDWNSDLRHLVHKLMRLAFEQRATWLVESLELDRKHVTAQLSFALADCEEKVSGPTV